MSLEAPNLNNKAALLNKDALAVLLRENATIFEYDYGTKQVDISWDKRRKRIVNSNYSFFYYFLLFFITFFKIILVSD